MRLSRMGSAHQTRLSFMRVLLRRLRQERWRFDRPVWRINSNGEGCAVYRARGPRRAYSLVAFAHDLPDAMRSDRVIATAWDATFALFDGEPAEADLERLSQHVPKQEAGRVQGSELSLSRANRSVRLWDHVVTQLAEGRQPDAARIDAVGYLMRTTAVYGSGKFGAADRTATCDRPLMGGPFRLEMLSVWLTRAFSLDLVEHQARVRGGDQAAVIDPTLRRRFGVGNSTGLGMAPFLVNHPALLHAWMTARETALARVCALPEATPSAQRVFEDRLARARRNARDWRSDHAEQSAKLEALRGDLAALAEHVAAGALTRSHPWRALIEWSSDALTLEGQEQLAALTLEPYGALVDDLAEAMVADEEATFRIDGTQRVSALRDALAQSFGWALDTNFDAPKNCARFWYVSEEKLEPRLGERLTEPGARYELPLDTARSAAALRDALEPWSPDASVAEFLVAQPEHRHTVRRVQIAARFPYAEIQDNLLDAEMRPLDLLRCKLSFFGATRFDPRSDRWLRICMYQDAPFPHELHHLPEDDWAYPRLEAG